MGWLEINRNRKQILRLQQEREQLVKDAILGIRNKKYCRNLICFINNEIERLYLEGKEIEYFH